MRLKDMTCVVTGGAMGIGRACALRYASEGAAVAVVDLAESEGHGTVAEIVDGGGRAAFIPCDVSSAQDCHEAVEAATRTFGAIDLMHANAGIEHCAPILNTKDDDWQHVLMTNLNGVFYCCRDALRAMVSAKTRGVITVTASPLALATARDIAAYTASKGGVLSFVRALALEAAAFGIRANALVPGTTDTPMIRREVSVSTDPDGMLRRWADSIPLGRLATPDDIASAAVFLASDDARFITGASLVVDGGQLAAFNTGPVYGYTD